MHFPPLDSWTKNWQYLDSKQLLAHVATGTARGSPMPPSAGIRLFWTSSATHFIPIAAMVVGGGGAGLVAAGAGGPWLAAWMAEASTQAKANTLPRRVGHLLSLISAAAPSDGPRLRWARAVT